MNYKLNGHLMMGVYNVDGVRCFKHYIFFRMEFKQFKMEYMKHELIFIIWLDVRIDDPLRIQYQKTFNWL